MVDFFKIPPIIARRMDDANKRALKRMGEDIARIGSLNNYKDAQLVAVKLTGESVEEITRELSKASGMTETEIEKLYADAARYDYEFAEQFYLNQEQIPFEENKTLQRTVKALTRASQTYCENLSHSYAFALRDHDGRIRYTSLRAGYKEAIDKAVTAVRFGTTDYKAEMRRVLKQYADSGVRIVDWESGYSQRIDTAVRRNIMEGLRRVKNETQNQIGKEFGADGYEISAHENPAPDHADIQGRQFSFADFEALNESLKRPIGTLNCYHTVTAIILGISPPAYTEAQLQEMKRKSNELIDIDGKKYTRYDCTQLQRQIETKIRKLKDRKELFKAAGDDVGIRECNRKIRLLKDKYNEITQKAGLNAHYDRMGKLTIKQSGGKYTIGDVEWSERRDEEAEKYYSVIRKSNDIEAIAKSSGMSIDDICTIKNHVFFDDTHKKHDGVGMLDADYNMAVAWKRLSEGVPEERDILLLRHELLENQYEKMYNLTVSQAHKKANAVYPWWDKLIEELGEGGEKDGLL